MASYYLETKQSPEKVIEKAIATFGEGGLGLEVTEQAHCCARFEGGGGHIFVTASEGDKTKVDLETREWDYQVKQFMRRLG
jgi:hypothetical protein